MKKILVASLVLCAFASVNQVQAAKKITAKIEKVKVEKKYINIDKMIEYSDFEEADKTLKSIICKNPNDIDAKALWVVSLAKQYKLDPAQKELDVLLKKYPNNADLHYAQGIIYYKRTTSSNMAYITNTPKLFSDAYEEFDKATSLDKNNAKAYNAKGVISMNVGRLDEAKTAFKKALEIEPKFSTAIDNLGTIDYLEGKLEDAEKKFKQALIYNTSNISAMSHLAQIAIQRQDYAAAHSHLNNALAINPNYYIGYNLMGEIYEKQGNEAAAINAYKKSIMIKPEYGNPYYNLAGIYEKRGDMEFAIEELKTALSINPEDYDARLKIADISLASGKYTQAIDNYSKLVGVKDFNDFALKGLADSYFEQAKSVSSNSIIASNNDFLKALDNINKAIAIKNNDLELHLAKLKLSKITNQPELSKKVLQDIIDSPDNNLSNTVIKGESYLALNDYKQAEKMFATASKMAQNNQESLYLAEIFTYHKQYENAKAVLKNILALDSENQQAKSDLDYIYKCEKLSNQYFQSAEFFIKNKNQSLALEYLSRSIGLNPNNAKAHLYIANIFEKQKDYKSAIINYELYLNLEKNSMQTKNVKKKLDRLNKKIKIVQ